MKPLSPHGEREGPTAKQWEGEGCVQSRADHLENAARVFKNVIVPKAQDSESQAPEIRIASPVGVALGVLTAIRLDDQALLDTSEVDDIRCNDVLAAKLHLRHALVAKHGPEPPFGGRGIGAHLASPVAQLSG